MNLINLREIGNNALKVIRSPKTEMILAFIIEMSKNYIFASIHQFTGDQLLYNILQYLILLIPWIMLGHGALRYEAQTKYETYSNIGSKIYPSTLKRKKNLNLLSIIFITFVFVKFLIT